MEIEVNAQARTKQGTGASRRLRRAGKTPGIVYGGDEPAVAIEVDHNQLYQHLRRDAFHASILMLNVDGQKQRVVLRAFNMHPFRREVQHVDFQRVQADEQIQIKVPLRFLNQEDSPAVKLSNALVTHVLTELDVRCLPGNLPEFIEVDLGHLELTSSIHTNDLVLPEGVELAPHTGEAQAVVTVAPPRVAEAELDEEAGETEATAAPEEGQGEE